MKRKRDYFRNQVERIVNNRAAAWFTHRSFPIEFHRFHKHRPFACKVSGCQICHKSPSEMKYYEKHKVDLTGELVWDEETEELEYWDRVADILYREELYGEEGSPEYDLTEEEQAIFYRAGGGVATAIERGLGETVNFSSAFSHYSEVA